MKNISKSYLVGKWSNDDWWFELTMFNYLFIGWKQGGSAIGAWHLERNKVIFTFSYLGEERRQIYMFVLSEFTNDNVIRVVELETNKVEVLKRD